MHEALSEQIADTLALAGDARDALTVTPCATGGNNRVFTVVLPGRKLVAKVYFRHPADKRDRLRSEYAFLIYAKHAGIRCVPQPVACNPESGTAIYEHVAGAPISREQLTASHVDQAADFFRALNDEGCREAARDLPAASEACFTIRDHMDMVDDRIARLRLIPDEGELSREAQRFVVDLANTWRSVQGALLTQAVRAGLDPTAHVEARCISPSDFGFHNALVGEDGRISFVDFEYAGWDDPAKMAGDFFSHPAVPVNQAWFEPFLERTMTFSPAAIRLAGRARMLLPLFRIKWCCIMLNEFIPEFAQRRRFANPALDQAAHKRVQLDKARSWLEFTKI